jgi:hypothetical protein
MTAFPVLKTAKDLVAERIIPCSEDTLRALAKKHGIGRILGRTYVFQPGDVAALVERLPCPSISPAVLGPRIGTSAGPSEASSLTKALALATAHRPRKSSSSAPQKSSNDQSTVIPLPARSPKRR